MPRMLAWLARTPRRATLAVLAAILFSAAHPPSAIARAITVRPDGSGDVPTFQAGVDSLIKGTQPVDTLLVMSGYYDEALDFDDGTAGGSIVCPSGPSKTGVRAIHFASEASHAWRGGDLFFEGLAVRQPLREGQFSPQFMRWDRCRFDGGFVSGSDEGSHPPITRCEFRGASKLFGDLRVQECRFVNAPVSADAASFVLTFDRCSFEGPADPAALVVTGDGDDIGFHGCAFSGSRRAILIYEPSADVGLLAVKSCRFEDISGAAIERESFDSEADLARRIPGVLVNDSHFQRCGRIVYLHGPGRSDLTMQSDTVLDCTSTAVEARIKSSLFGGLVLERCGGSGLILTASPLAYDLHGVSYPAEFRAWVDHCSISDVQGDGITLDPRLPMATMPRSAQVADSRVVRAGGNGIRVIGDSLHVSGSLVIGCELDGVEALVAPGPLRHPNGPTVLLDHNTVAGNGGSGLTSRVGVLRNNLAVANGGSGISGSRLVYSSGNDSWRNRFSAYAGLAPGSPDLTEDPQLCDPEHGDFQVAQSSPCAPSGTYGQIGAFGVGCDRMRVAVEVVDLQRETKRGRGGSNLAGVLVLGSRYFDARRIDVASVTLKGAHPVSSAATDSTDDGYANLLLYFRRSALHGPRGDELATLEGRTVDGAPFVSNLRDQELLRAAAAISPSSELQLAIDAVTPNPATSPPISVRFTLPRSEPATLELVDVAGRRVFAKDLGMGAGQHEVTVGADERMHAGVYWLRLRQVGTQVTSRIVVIR